MAKASLSERLKTSALVRPSEVMHNISAVRDMAVFREEDSLTGKVHKTRALSGRARSGALGGQLSKLLSGRRPGGRFRAKGANAAFAQDRRQRVVVTVFYQGHGGSGAGRLIAHGKYLERDGAGPEGEPGQFYDHEQDRVEAGPRLAQWADDDKRHMRLMLAPESGARIEDLKDFTRATMAQMERDLGAPLDWVAVDHHNTDNPHVHVILRGRRRDGPDLIIPRDYATWGLRHAAREVATQMLGDRGRDDERLALERETRAERSTRLDQLLAAELKPGKTHRIQSIGRGLEPTLRAALRNRVRELARMGLGQEEKRDRFRLDHDWAARLEEIGKGIDLRRRLGRELEPGQGRLKLYDRSMGRVVGPVLEAGRRGETGKGYLIVLDDKKRPVLANVRERDAAGLQPGALVAVEPTGHEGRGTRVRVDRLSETPLLTQIEAPAETELDREIVRQVAGEPPRLPNTREVRNAITERIGWHQREGNGGRDLTGRFEFNQGALDRLRGAELSRAEDALRRTTGKRAINIADGLEREWRVRGFVQLHQGRFAMLERNDGVALLRVTRSLSLKHGKAYSLSITNGKVKATPSLGLDR
jgi:type IV secretory pathway VirD2 relaxase